MTAERQCDRGVEITEECPREEKFNNTIILQSTRALFVHILSNTPSSYDDIFKQAIWFAKSNKHSKHNFKQDCRDIIT
jgi:hypothetical protein